jgi:hypothetical protein
VAQQAGQVAWIKSVFFLWRSASADKARLVDQLGATQLVSCKKISIETPKCCAAGAVARKCIIAGSPGIPINARGARSRS